MARPRREINPECGKRLKILLDETHTKQIELAKLISITPQTISQIINGKANLTPETADLITQHFPQYSKQWLLGNLPSEIKSDDDLLLETVELLHSAYNYVTDIKKEQRLAILDIVNRCGYSVKCDDGDITIQKDGTSKEITITESEASEYCDELSAMIKAFVDYHFHQHRRIKHIKIIKEE